MLSDRLGLGLGLEAAPPPPPPKGEEYYVYAVMSHVSNKVLVGGMSHDSGNMTPADVLRFSRNCLFTSALHGISGAFVESPVLIPDPSKLESSIDYLFSRVSCNIGIEVRQ